MRSRFIVALALATLGFTACVIGPKQDDPVGGTPADDSGVTADTGEFGAADTSTSDTSPAATTEIGDPMSDVGGPPGGDGGDAGDAGKGDADAGDAPSDADAVSDAATEGG